MENIDIIEDTLILSKKELREKMEKEVASANAYHTMLKSNKGSEKWLNVHMMEHVSKAFLYSDLLKEIPSTKFEMPLTTLD